MPTFERALMNTDAGGIEKASGQVTFATAAAGAAIGVKSLFLHFFRRCVSKCNGHDLGGLDRRELPGELQGCPTPACVNV